ncbi:MAG: hypothetical protein F4Y94_04125 [Chloroflexi bacterium]|nr:hypothetical protein [Chloroflexota bacterium]
MKLRYYNPTEVDVAKPLGAVGDHLDALAMYVEMTPAGAILHVADVADGCNVDRETAAVALGTHELADRLRWLAPGYWLRLETSPTQPTTEE